MTCKELVIANNYIISFEKGTSSLKVEAFLFLHGFPAHIGSKNQDIAAAVTEEFSCSSYVLHYPGLGNADGEFGFVKSVEESAKVAKALIRDRQLKKLHIVGHSWGALVALNVFKEIGQLGMLLLLAPFTIFSTDEEIIETILGVLSLNTVRFKGKNLERIFDDFQCIKKSFDPLLIVKNDVREDSFVKIVVAKKDLVIPKSSVIILQNEFKRIPEVFELDLDHSFSENRNLLISLIIKIIREYNG